MSERTEEQEKGVDLFAPLVFREGARVAPNRLFFGPLTNLQSDSEGELSEAEKAWLVQRAQPDNFGVISTCAAFTSREGQAFPGQLGVHSSSPSQLAKLQQLSRALQQHGALALVQLQHGGSRANPELTGGLPVLCPSLFPELLASTDRQRAPYLQEMTAAQVQGLIDGFVAAAVRVEQAGFDGVELHGAHGYLLCQFLSPQFNRRSDEYGGDATRRATVLRRIIAGIRAATAASFIVGVRLSPERFGLHTPDMIALAAQLMEEGAIDFIDLSIWDFEKDPEDPLLIPSLSSSTSSSSTSSSSSPPSSYRLLSLFTSLPRGRVKLGAAGKIRSGAAAWAALRAGLDFVAIGRAAILHHDFGIQVKRDPNFVPIATPVDADYLATQGVSPVFFNYLAHGWPDFAQKSTST